MNFQSYDHYVYRSYSTICVMSVLWYFLFGKTEFDHFGSIRSHCLENGSEEIRNNSGEFKH